MLLERGANINAANRIGFTPLHYAAQNVYPRAVIALIERGADINARTNNGETPLDLAIRTHRDTTITLLRARGARTGAELDEAAATIIPPANHNDIGLINLDRLNIAFNDEQTRTQAYYATLLLAAGLIIGNLGCNIL